MQELENIEEQLDASYKANRKKKEKEAIKTLLKNPKFFYSYQRKFSKTSDKITGFIDENGEIVTDAFKQSEMLRKQYQSVYSKPMRNYIVEDEFFTGCEECLQQKTHECWEDKWKYPDVEEWKPDSCSHRNGTRPFCKERAGETALWESSRAPEPTQVLRRCPGALGHLNSPRAGSGDSGLDCIVDFTTSPDEGTLPCAPQANLGCASGAEIVPQNYLEQILTSSKVGRGAPGCSDCEIFRLAGVEDGDLNDPYFDHLDCQDALDKLSRSAAPGPDGVPAVVLKEGKRQISRILSEIFKTSFDTGALPSLLKSSLIIPVHKGESKAEPCNYRNISLTSHLTKMFERVLAKPLVRHLEENLKMDPRQHGGRSGRSTLSQLILHHDQILKAMEEGASVDAIYLDFAKAFDKVDHGLLLHKLKRAGVKGKMDPRIFEE